MIAGASLALTQAAAYPSGTIADGPRTAWGDPDLQGIYTSDNSIGVPFERPEQFGTRAFLTPEEYAARVDANEEQLEKDHDPLPESEFSAEDRSAINASRHWLERPDVPSRATSMVVDPPDGRIPARTTDGEQRTAARRAARNRGLPRSYTDFTTVRFAARYRWAARAREERRDLTPPRGLRCVSLRAAHGRKAVLAARCATRGGQLRVTQTLARTRARR